MILSKLLHARLAPNTRPVMKLLVCSTLLLAATPALAQDIVAVKAGRILTMAGPDIQNGVILIDNGKITAIGKAADIETPWDAKVIDASKKVVMPTYVLAHTSGGMSQANERMANVPFLTVQDAVDPASRFFEECLRNGVGTIHVIPGNNTLMGGAGMVVRPYGKTVEDMAVLSRTGLKMSLLTNGSRMAKVQQMRRALKDIKDYMSDRKRRENEFKKEKAAGATTKEKFEDKIDDKKKPVVDLLNKKARAFFYVPAAAELQEAMRLCREYGILKHITFVLGSRCHKAAKMLARQKVAFILDGTPEYFERDPETEKEVRYCPPAALHKAGVTFAMSVAASTSGMTRYPWWQMGVAIRNGMPRDAALKAMTTVPAEILGLDDQIGTLAKDKIANLQILTGDPLNPTSWVDMVLLEGEVVYERSKDPRLQYLFGKKDSKSKNQKGTKK